MTGWLLWLWWWFHRCTYMPKLFQLCILVRAVIVSQKTVKKKKVKQKKHVYSTPGSHSWSSAKIPNGTVISMILCKYNEKVNWVAAAAAKSLQSCPTLCDLIDGSPPGSPVHGILQARTLEWVAISFSNAWKWKVKVKSFSRAQLLVTPWTAAYQASPPMGFSRQEYWSGVPWTE